MTAPGADDLLAPHPRIAARLIGGRALILDPETEALRRLNDTGSFIWSLITERRHTRDAILTALLDAFEVDAPTAAADLDALLAEFEAERLIIRRPSPPD